MPYARPSRKGLPSPPSEDEAKIPRSDSYLGLSDLANSVEYSDNSQKQDSSLATEEQKQIAEPSQGSKIAKLISITSTPESPSPEAGLSMPMVGLFKGAV